MAKKTKKKVDKALDFKSAFKYPFNRPAGLLNILWFLLPIIGWFALIGYCQGILRAIIAGNKTNLPEFIGFGDNLKRGFMLFVKLIPLTSYNNNLKIGSELSSRELSNVFNFL